MEIHEDGVLMTRKEFENTNGYLGVFASSYDPNCASWVRFKMKWRGRHCLCILTQIPPVRVVAKFLKIDRKTLDAMNKISNLDIAV